MSIPCHSWFDPVWSAEPSFIASPIFILVKALDHYLSVEFLERVNATPDTKADIIIAGKCFVDTFDIISYYIEKALQCSHCTH